MAAGTFHRHSVLVLEDVADSRDALKLLLESEGYEVTAAANGVEALRTMQTFRPCVAIADIIMPTMDGLSFRQELLKRAEVAATPVVAVTGHEGLRRHALTEGFAAALLKPVRPEELTALVAGHCSERRDRDTQRR
jgi:chemosensory pili system protein ChpA (sensor histidine kinase/response regulator)